MIPVFHTTTGVTASGVTRSLAATEVDPAVFQAPTDEQRSFLLEHKDVLVYAPHERGKFVYGRLSRAYQACPPVLRILVTLVLIILLLCVVPVLLYLMYMTLKRQPVESISIAILMVLLYALWTAVIRDI